MDEKFKEGVEFFERLFEVAEFSQNKIQQTAQHVEERDIFDIIDRLIALQKELKSQKSETEGIGETLKLIVELLKALGDENVQKAIAELLRGERR